MSTEITLKMQIGAKPDVITLLDGHAKPNSRNQFISYPAIKFPGVKDPVVLIETDQDKPRPAKSHAAASKLAAKMVKDIIAKAKEAQAAKVKKV